MSVTNWTCRRVCPHFLDFLGVRIRIPKSNIALLTITLLSLNRCVTRDYGYIGCSANVLDLLDRTCSGQRTCRLGVPTLRDLVQPCPKDLTSYLDVTYRCVSGKTNRYYQPTPMDPRDAASRQEFF